MAGFERLRTALTAQRIGLGFLAVSMLGVLRAELPTLSPPLWLNMDEGYGAALGLRLAHDGGLPYVNAVDQRGPLLHWVYELVVLIGGPFEVRPVRIGGLLFAELSVLAVFFATRALRGPALAAGLASFVFALHLALFKSPFDALALNGELIAIPFVMGAFAVLAMGLTGLEKRSRLLLFAAGALVTLGFFTKQTLGGHIVVAAAWTFLAPGDMRARVTRAAWLGGGILATIACVLLPYALTGGLHAFSYYFTTYGRMAYLGPTTHDDVIKLATAYYIRRYYLFVLLGAGALIWRRGLAEKIAVVNAIAAIPGSILTGRALWHYFMPFEALLSVILGLALASRSVPRGVESALRLTAVAALVLLAVWWPKGPSILLSGEPAMPHNSIDPANEPLGRWVAASTQPEDRLFVWGFRADVYTTGHHYPASRFVYSIFQSGFAPWSPEPLDIEERRVAEGSREATLRDLENTRAEIIIDAGASLAYRYMTTYPVFRHYLDEHYCLAAVINEIPIYRRSGQQACVPIPPPPHQPVIDRAGVKDWLRAEEHAEGWR